MNTRVVALTTLLGLSGLVVLLTASPVSGAEGDLVRVSVASDGSEGNEGSLIWGPSLSADGRYVTFVSEADNLIPGDTNGSPDVFVRDQITNQTMRISVSSAGQQGNANSGLFEGALSKISADGDHVVFTSQASNLVADDTNGSSDVFVHDVDTGETHRVSVSSNGDQGDDTAIATAITANGRYVAFSSWATNLVPNDTNGVPDVFVHDRQTGQTTRVSVASNGAEADGGSIYTAISSTGRYVAFDSEASNLVANDVNAERDVFVHDRQTGQTRRVSVSSSGTSGNGFSLYPTISGDGRFVMFNSEATNLVTDDTNGARDVFVHDRQTGGTRRVSVVTGGAEANGESAGSDISATGRYVVFDSTASDLVPDDTNGVSDSFVHDLQTGETTRVSVDTDGEQGDGDSYFPAINANGRYVAFSSDATNLVAGDTNSFTDVFVYEFKAGSPGTTTSTTSSTTTSTTAPAGSLPTMPRTGDYFVDDDGHTFEDDIDWAYRAGVTRGCNPPVNDRYCPDDLVTRGQMAAFLVRALGYVDAGGGDLFVDDDGDTFEHDIDRLGSAGVTSGCNPPVNDRYCPDDLVTRGQMAAFLVRALGYVDDGGGDLFVDDDGDTFEHDIDRLGSAGVTRGCNPPVNDRFCPDDLVTRGQMAAFLHRALVSRTP